MLPTIFLALHLAGLLVTLGARAAQVAQAVRRLWRDGGGLPWAIELD